MAQAKFVPIPTRGDNDSSLDKLSTIIRIEENKEMRRKLESIEQIIRYNFTAQNELNALRNTLSTLLRRLDAVPECMSGISRTRKKERRMRLCNEMFLISGLIINMLISAAILTFMAIRTNAALLPEKDRIRIFPAIGTFAKYLGELNPEVKHFVALKPISIEKLTAQVQDFEKRSEEIKLNATRDEENRPLCETAFIDETHGYLRFDFKGICEEYIRVFQMEMTFMMERFYEGKVKLETYIQTKLQSKKRRTKRNPIALVLLKPIFKFALKKFMPSIARLIFGKAAKEGISSTVDTLTTSSPASTFLKMAGMSFSVAGNAYLLRTIIRTQRKPRISSYNERLYHGNENNILILSELQVRLHHCLFMFSQEMEAQISAINKLIAAFNLLETGRLSTELFSQEDMKQLNSNISAHAAMFDIETIRAGQQDSLIDQYYFTSSFIIAAEKEMVLCVVVPTIYKDHQLRLYKYTTQTFMSEDKIPMRLDSDHSYFAISKQGMYHALYTEAEIADCEVDHRNNYLCYDGKPLSKETNACFLFLTRREGVTAQTLTNCTFKKVQGDDFEFTMIKPNEYLYFAPVRVELTEFCTKDITATNNITMLQYSGRLSISERCSVTVGSFLLSDQAIEVMQPTIIPKEQVLNVVELAKNKIGSLRKQYDFLINLLSPSDITDFKAQESVTQILSRLAALQQFSEIKTLRLETQKQDNSLHYLWTLLVGIATATFTALIPILLYCVRYKCPAKRNHFVPKWLRRNTAETDHQDQEERRNEEEEHYGRKRIKRGLTRAHDSVKQLQTVGLRSSLKRKMPDYLSKSLADGMHHVGQIRPKMKRKFSTIDNMNRNSFLSNSSSQSGKGYFKRAKDNIMGRSLGNMSRSRVSWAGSKSIMNNENGRLSMPMESIQGYPEEQESEWETDDEEQPPIYSTQSTPRNQELVLIETGVESENDKDSKYPTKELNKLIKLDVEETKLSNDARSLMRKASKTNLSREHSGIQKPL